MHALLCVAAAGRVLTPMCATLHVLCSQMCKRLEAAFIQLWQEAGLGPLPPPAHPTSRGGQREQQGQQGHRSRGPSKQQSLEHLIHHGPPVAPPQPPKRQRTAEPSPAATAASAGDAAAALHQQHQQQQGGMQQQDELAELAEEELALERLLSTAGGSFCEDPAASAAADCEPSPLFWDVPPPAGPSMSGGGAAGAAAPGMPAAPGATGAMAVSALGPGQWQAPAQSPFQTNQASAALLHPGRGAADSLSAPAAVMMPHQPQLQQKQLQNGPSQPLSGLLSGLVAATASVTLEQLQQEQRVLGAWRRLQQQRLAAARAAAAADQAVAELALARMVGPGN